MRGRKPEPTALKILKGAQPCRINHSEPHFDSASLPQAPDWLGAYGLQLWARLAPALHKAGLLTIGDIPAFEQLCDEYDGIRRDRLDNAARDRYRKLLVEFGLTPSSRSRIKAPAEQPRDAFAEFVAKRQA